MATSIQKLNNPSKPNEFLKTALKMKNMSISKTDLKQNSGSNPPTPHTNNEWLKEHLNKNTIGNLLQRNDLKTKLSENVINDLISSHKNNEPVASDTVKALINGDLIEGILKSNTQQARQSVAAPAEQPQRQKSSSRSKRKLDSRNPGNEFRNIEGVKPAENYYSKLFRDPSAKKTASQLYRSKPQNQSKYNNKYRSNN